MLFKNNLMSRRNFIILKALVKTDYKLRYQGSILGHFWDFIKPLAMFAVRFFVFVNFLGLGVGVNNFPLSLFLATVIWTFFQEATTKCMTIASSRRDMIRKAKIPSFVIVLSAFYGSVINLAINLSVFFVILVFSGITFSFKLVFLIPLLLELFIFTLGVSFLLSVIFAYFRDIEALWSIVMQVFIYAMPIIYPINRIIAYNKDIANIMMMNPLAQIIQDARYLIVGTDNVTIGQMLNSSVLVLLPYLISFVIFVLGIVYFNKYSKKFPEIL